MPHLLYYKYQLTVRLISSNLSFPRRHKDQAPHKYMMLEQTLRQDPRLAEFSWKTTTTTEKKTPDSLFYKIKINIL